ncbi:hypothetical protein [Absidia glauca]|uniref:Uncharacterized protein n=1 Tax=Absidia glauca TaxID=4829 RepID=A0A168M2K5_ABSGL|nr:hypothetical protein [Absidia glauca]
MSERLKIVEERTALMERMDRKLDYILEKLDSHEDLEEETVLRTVEKPPQRWVVAKDLINKHRAANNIDPTLKWSHLPQTTQLELITELERIMAAGPSNILINTAIDQWIARQVLANGWANTVPRTSMRRMQA